MKIDRDIKLKMVTHGLDGNLKTSAYVPLISQAMNKIHSQIPKENYDTTKVACTSDIRYENFGGKEYQRAVMYLISNGCEWALRNSNGCTMCGHIAKQTRNKMISSEHYVQQFLDEFEKIDFQKSPLLNIYNNGSFLNDNEVPYRSRKIILKKVNKDPRIKMLVIESRPEYVSEEKIQELDKFIPDKHVELAIGLEVKDDFIRRVCLNKGFTLNQYNYAASMILQSSIKLMGS